MEPYREIPVFYIVVLLVIATSGHHFLRGCQDVDPRCALLDEMTVAGGKVEYTVQIINLYVTSGMRYLSI